MANAQRCATPSLRGHATRSRSVTARHSGVTLTVLRHQTSVAPRDQRVYIYVVACEAAELGWSVCRGGGWRGEGGCFGWAEMVCAGFSLPSGTPHQYQHQHQHQRPAADTPERTLITDHTGRHCVHANEFPVVGPQAVVWCGTSVHQVLHLLPM